MPDALIAFRKTDRLTRRCQVLDVPMEHAVGNHRGDAQTVLAAAKLTTLSEMTRTSYAWVLVVDVPSEIAAKAKQWLLSSSFIDEIRDRPKVLNLNIPLFKIEYPAQANNIDKLFDPERTQSIVSIVNFPIPWAKFKRAVKHGILNRVMTDEEWEVDPDGA